MKFLNFKSDQREDIITSTSTLGIIVNLFIAAAKVLIGVVVSSMAITSEGINNAADALSSTITLVGTKLAQKNPDKKHPFGYGRIEYLTSLVIAILILITGVEVLSNSVQLIFHPVAMSISYISIIIVAVSAVIKFFLGVFTINMGKKAQSKALEGVGLEGRNDSFASIITIAVAAIFLFSGLSLDAYAGIFTSILIIKAGYEILSSTVSELIGRPGDHDLALKIYREVRRTDGILGAVDMMLHNYGPDSWSGSVNIEVDHAMTVGEIYKIVHPLQLSIMQKYNVVMVFGIYAVDHDHQDSKEAIEVVGNFMKQHEHIKSFHALYIEPETGRIYCDFIVDYDQKDWKGLRKEFLDYMSLQYPGHEVVLTIETEFV